MMSVPVKFKKLHPDAVLPTYAHPTDAGMDLSTVQDFSLSPGESKLINTGLAMALLEGYEAQVRPRSGLALKHAITVVNSPGTIDSQYRGPVGVILINHGARTVDFKAGDRIAQMVIAPVVQAEVLEVDELDDTDRGAGGFGSTGV